MERRVFWGFLVTIAAGLSFGFIPIIVALLRDLDVSILEQTFLRLFFGGITGFLGLLGYIRWKREKFNLAIRKEVQKTYIWQGLFFTVAIMVYIGSIILDTPVGEAALLIQVHPLITLILGALLLNEIVDRRKIYSLVLGFMGLILLTRPWEWKEFFSSFLGDLLATLNGVLYAIYLVIGASSVKVRAKIPPSLSIFWVLVWGFVWGIMIILILYLLPFNSDFLSFSLQNLTLTPILVLGVFLAILGSVLPYGLLMLSNKYEIESSIQSILLLGEPIAAVILGYLVLTEPITSWYLIGGFFLLLAIINILSTAN